MKLPPITHMSILLLQRVPGDYNSECWLSMMRGSKQSCDDKIPPHLLMRGIIDAIRLDHEPGDGAWIMGTPTVYLRVRADHPCVLAVVPFPVEKTARKFQGERCEVLLSTELGTEIDRDQLMKEYEEQAFNFNNAVAKRMVPFREDEINIVYNAACVAICELVLARGNLNSKRALLQSHLNDTRHSRFPMADRVGYDDYPVQGSIPETVADTFELNRPIVICAPKPPEGHEVFESVANQCHPGWMSESLKEAQEANLLCEGKGFVPCYLVSQSPVSPRYSGYLHYYPTPSTKSGGYIDIVSIGINRDERRQGYGFQLLMRLARDYPNRTISMTVDCMNYQACALARSIGHSSQTCVMNRDKCTHYDYSFSYESFFPVESFYLETFKNQLKKGNRRRKK